MQGPENMGPCLDQIVMIYSNEILGIAFLQLEILHCFWNDDLQVLSMSRLGAAEAVVPLITDGQAEVLYPSLSVST